MEQEKNDEQEHFDMFAPPTQGKCDLCGTTFKINGWKEYSRYCPDCTFIVGKFKLQAEVDAHRVFSDSGCDMYGSQADPNLDRGWLDGYKAGRFDGFVDKWKWDNLVLQDGDACKVDESQSYSIKLTMKQAGLDPGAAGPGPRHLMWVNGTIYLVDPSDPNLVICDRPFEEWYDRLEGTLRKLQQK